MNLMNYCYISNLVYVFNIQNNFDFPVQWQTNFQDPATPLMEGIIDLHHHIFFFLVLILTLVIWLLIKILIYFGVNNNYIIASIKNQNNLLLFNYVKKIIKTSRLFTHNYVIETVWTILPSLVLLLIAIPSFALLYSIDEIINSELTIKIIGHQWYWTYDFSLIVPDIQNYSIKTQIFEHNFDSYMVPTDDLDLNNSKLNFRLLEVDAPLYLPTHTHIRLLISAADVLHSWAVPSLGIKMDAVPGRLNQVSIFIKRPGVFYGQCSEICGINHGFMPILVRAISVEDFRSIFFSFDEAYNK